MKSVGITDVGKKRSMNQDSIFYTDEAVGPVQNLYIVADGMGGQISGSGTGIYRLLSFPGKPGFKF